KTGPLNKNEMTVRQVFAGNELFELSGTGYDPSGSVRRAGVAIEPNGEIRELLRAGTLASDARLVDAGGSWRVEGDPTEGALIVAATKAGMNVRDLNEQESRTDEIPFTSERRRMTTLHQTTRGTTAYSKGATEQILASSSAYRLEG